MSRLLFALLLTFVACSPASAELVTLSPTQVIAGTVITSNLPACSSATSGMYYLVTDALTPLIAGVLTGGGAVTVVVKCNGTSWLVI